MSRLIYQMLMRFWYILHMQAAQALMQAPQGLFCWHVRIQRGGQGPDPPPPSPLKKYTNIRFLSNTGQDPLKNHKATKPAFNVYQLSACQRNAI